MVSGVLRLFSLHTVPEDMGTTYMGCYIDNPTRALSAHSTGGSDMTVEKCLAYCRSFGDVHYAGVQYGGQCFCGDDYNKYGKVSEIECRATCSGNSEQYCGGTWRNSVYLISGKV